MEKNRIKAMQTTLPRGAPFDTACLEQLGISPALAHAYVKSGWLEKLGRGVFMFAGDTLELDASLRFLESRIAGLHLAGKSSLARHGFRQNVPSRESVILWGEGPVRLPAWFTDRFPARYSSAKLFEQNLERSFGIAPLPESPEGPQVSGPERALLEMLSEVGVHQELEEARAIMEGVRQLRRRVLGRLLENCRQVKTVRFCALWARELGLSWAGAAEEAGRNKMGTGRWVARLKNGQTLILKPE